MSKPSSIQINIPIPCSQSWDEMTPADHGRFCSHCSKTVIDFTTYSDTQLYNFFAKNDDHVCGRYFSSQLNRPIYIPPQPHSRLYQLTAALGLTLLFTQTPQLLAQTRPPISAQNSPTKISDTTQQNASATSGSITGNIVDDKKEPLPSAVIQVYQKGILKGGSPSDFDGNYTIVGLEAGDYDAIAIYNGYDSAKTVVNVRLENKTVLNLVLNRHATSITGVITIINFRKPLIDIDNPSKHTFTREDLNHMPN